MTQLRLRPGAEGALRGGRNDGKCTSGRSSFSPLAQEDSEEDEDMGHLVQDDFDEDEDMDEVRSWLEVREEDGAKAETKVGNKFQNNSKTEMRGGKNSKKTESITEDLEIMSANVGGAAGAWRILDEISKQDVDVACLQETALTDQEGEAFRRASKLRGYRCYSIGGYTHTDRWGGERRRGGVAILVKLSCAQRPGSTKEKDTAAAIFVEVQGWKLGAVYAPPHEYDLRKLADILQEASEEEKLSSQRRWCVAGDFNEDAKNAHASLSYTVLHGAGGELIRVGEATRWQGNREVDWIISSRRVEKPEILEAWISDHKALKWRLPVTDPVEACGSLKEAPKWRKPGGVTPATWRKILEEEIQQLRQDGNTKQLEDMLNNPQIDVENEWNMWNEILDETMRKATKRVMDQHEIPEETLKTLTKNLEVKMRKGMPAKHISRRTMRQWQVEDKSIEQRKRRKWLARASQLLRKVENEGENAAEGEKIRKKVEKRLEGKHNEQIGESQQSFESRLRMAIEKEKQEMTKEETQQRSHHIKSWKEKMKEGISEVARWMKNRKQGQTPTLHRKGVDACTREEACRQIAAHWKDVWFEEVASEHKVRKREPNWSQTKWTVPRYSGPGQRRKTSKQSSGRQKAVQGLTAGKEQNSDTYQVKRSNGL